MSVLALPNSSAAATTSALRDVLLGLLVGALCYGISCVLVAPGAVAITFGTQWQDMSVAPFELRGQFPHRMLAPLLAHCVGMGGDAFVLFVRGLAVLLLGTVFFFCRRQGSAVVDALLVTFAVAVTATIQMYKQHWVGFVDPLGYTLFFWMWLAARRPVVFWGLFLANLFNHELAAFLLPWLWFVRRCAAGSRRADVLGAGLALAIYAAFYFWVKANAPAQLYSVDYFAEHPLFPGGTFVVVSLALVHLVVAFGPVLAVLAWHQHVREHGRERWHLWLVLAGVLAIFCIAFDWARHTNLIVLPFALASIRFLAAGYRVWYVGLVALGVALMLWVPPWSPTAWPTHAMAAMDLWLRTGVVVVIDGDYFPGSLRAAALHWLPEVAPTFAVIGAIFAAIWLTGWWFARWSERRVLPRD